MRVPSRATERYGGSGNREQSLARATASSTGTEAVGANQSRPVPDTRRPIQKDGPMAMQQDRSSGYACSRIDVGPALSAGQRNANGFHDNHKETVRKDAPQPEFRTQVVVGQAMVTGVLPGAAWVEGSLAISGDVRRLSCSEALELVDALLLVVTRMDVVAEERHGTPIDVTGDRED